MIGLGTAINVAGIVLGGVFGLILRKPLGGSTQTWLKNALGAMALVCGVRLMWMGVGGTFVQVLKQLGIILLALIAGKIVGGLLRLQKTSNRLGQFARDRMAAAGPDNPNRFTDGFAVCAALFCAAPLGIVGSVTDGLAGFYYPLVIKAVMDGLAVMSFVALFGSGVILSAVPVLILQGTITLLCARFLAPFLTEHALRGPVDVAAGFLILCVALLIFEIKKIKVADYFPGLALAPFLAWLFR